MSKMDIGFYTGTIFWALLDVWKRFRLRLGCLEVLAERLGRFGVVRPSACKNESKQESRRWATR